MKNKNTTFNPVFGASGILNFHGEGYPYHTLLFWGLLFTPLWVPLFRILRQSTLIQNWLKKRTDIFFWKTLYELVMVSFEIPILPVVFSHKGMVLITKTIVLTWRDGNMELQDDGVTPREFNPKCIHVDMIRKSGLNNVALSCIGLVPLLNKKGLQNIEGNFIISIMPVGKAPIDRINEIIAIRAILEKNLPEFVGNPILQINISCPNTGDELDAYLEEVFYWIKELRKLGIPITIKGNFLTPIDAMIKIINVTDGAFISNTVPFDSLTSEEKIKYFGSDISPLEKFQPYFKVPGKGGVSGAYLFPKVERYFRELRRQKVTKPLIFGGGILDTDDVYAARAAGADGISPGSITMIAPWNLRKVIKCGNRIFPKVTF